MPEESNNAIPEIFIPPASPPPLCKGGKETSNIARCSLPPLPKGGHKGDQYCWFWSMKPGFSGPWTWSARKRKSSALNRNGMNCLRSWKSWKTDDQFLVSLIYLNFYVKLLLVSVLLNIISIYYGINRKLFLFHFNNNFRLHLFFNFFLVFIEHQTSSQNSWR